MEKGEERSAGSSGDMIPLDSNKPSTPIQKSALRKVYAFHYDHETGKPHPMIRIRGKYLASLGFAVGDTIQVQLDFGRITISKTNGEVKGKKP